MRRGEKLGQERDKVEQADLAGRVELQDLPFVSVYIHMYIQ